MQLYGLVGRHISYSFSRAYFTQKFGRLGIDARYENFDIDDISLLEKITVIPGLRGFNVTIPYKREVIPYLDNLSPEASRIGAVNTVKIEADGKRSGHNTDWIGFTESLQPHLESGPIEALVLGTGGASLAVTYALDRLGIGHQSVSRTGSGLRYGNLSRKDFPRPLIIVNCTPVGTAPDVGISPIDGQFFRPGDIAFDLIYNPPRTRFLYDADVAGATILNGLRMLEIQAERAWEIWNAGTGADFALKIL